MKKLFFVVAVATLFFSCQKEIEPTNTPSESKGITFTAAIENLATRADINASNELVWATGDKIGIYDGAQQAFTLEGAGGNTTGTFKWDSGEYSGTSATVAYFPWGNDNNMSDNGNMYFHLLPSYSEYTSGKMLTPLVAELSLNGDKYAPIEFKHAGAAVKVTINNLPAGAHSIGLSADQPVAGYFNVAKTAFGSSSIVPNADNAVENSIWLNYNPADEEREFTFLFPVPALTTPKFTFQIWDENNLLVWEKSPKNAQPSIIRGDVLEMPALDITPYSSFNKISEDWVIRGYFEGNDWTYDVGAVTDGTTYIVKGVKVIGEGDQCAIKVKHPGDSWDGSWPDGNYKITTGAGTYDIIFTPTNQSVKAVPSRCPYPDANVSFYFRIDRTSNDIKFKSSDLRTASWPGDSPEATEGFGGSKFYKWSYPANLVWGNTITYSLVDAGNWSLDDATFTFTEKKQVYFFHMDSNKNVTEIAKPVEPKLAIDGSFNDWSVLEGNSYGPNSHDNTTTMKAFAKGTDLFIYLKVAGTYDLESGRYVRLYFDTDNNQSTGSTDWYRKGADDIPTGIDSFLVYFNHSGSVANADIQGIGSNYQLKVAEGTGCLEAEICVPLSVLGTITGDTINLFCLGYYPSEFTGNLAGVYIP